MIQKKPKLQEERNLAKFKIKDPTDLGISAGHPAVFYARQCPLKSQFQTGEYLRLQNAQQSTNYNTIQTQRKFNIY